MHLVGADPYIIVTMAAERRARFLAEATDARRLSQLPSGRRNSRALRCVLAVRDSSRWGVGRTPSWGALVWRYQVLMSGDG